MNAVVLTFDSLRLSSLGCYGNLSHPTMGFDDLATASMLFDQHFGENFDDQAQNHAWWTGLHQFPRSKTEQRACPAVLKRLREAGVITRLFLEEPASATTPPVSEFDEVVRVDGEDGLHISTDDVPFARLVQQAAQHLERCQHETNAHSLCWLKSRGVPTPWIAPKEFAEQLEISPEEGQAAVTRFLSGQNGTADGRGGDNHGNDRDGRLVQEMYAAYVLLLDRWLGRLLDAVNQFVSDKGLLLIVTAAAGGSLNDRLFPSTIPARMRDEFVHVPLFVHAADSALMGSRSQELVQTIDLAPTLLEWFGLNSGEDDLEGQSLLPLVRDGVGPGRREIFVGDLPEACAIRTRDFYCVKRTAEQGSDSAGSEHLFVKPDDIWDIHDVAQIYPDQVTSLVTRLDEFVRLGEGFRVGEAR